jgi:DNA-binding CsgD family transcriptional regulator/PAS domain-containing protein
VWHTDRDSTARCIAIGGSLHLPSSIEAVAMRRRSGEQTAPVMRWRLLGPRSERQVQITIPLSSGVLIVVAAFTDDDRAQAELDPLLSSLTAEAAPFFGLFEAALEADTVSTRLRHAADLSGVGVIVVDIHANVLFANSAAERICDHSKALRLTDGTLRAGALHDSLRLHAAIEHVVRQDEGKKSTIPVVALSRTRGRPMMITLHPVTGSSNLRDQDGAILCVFDPESEAAASINPLCEFYRLSAMESKLAEMMARGQSLIEAAERLGLKEHTARSYLKQIFQKTGTNRQGELVALLLRTSVHCAPKQHASLVD